MRAGHPRGDDDLFRIAGAEAGDIVPHRAVEQLDVLGQVADGAPEGLAVPAIDVAAIQPHDAVRGLDGPDDQARQGRLARGAGPHDAEGFAGLQGEADIGQDRVPPAGGHIGQVLD